MSESPRILTAEADVRISLVIPLETALAEDGVSDTLAKFWWDWVVTHDAPPAHLAQAWAGLNETWDDIDGAEALSRFLVDSGIGGLLASVDTPVRQRRDDGRYTRSWKVTHHVWLWAETWDRLVDLACDWANGMHAEDQSACSRAPAAAQGRC